MGKVEEVQEKVKADMEAMATMMEAMMSMKKIMEANAVAVAATSAVTKYGRPHDVQIQNKHVFPPYGLPPNYTSPIVAYTPNKDVNNSTPILIESQQPKTDHAPMGEAHKMPHHNLADFKPCLGYATEGQAVGDIPLQNTWEGPQYHPQLHPLHSTLGKNPHAMAEMGDERIDMGPKRGKFSHPAWTNEKTGANEEGEDEGETHVVTAIPIWPSFPPTQQCRYSANNNPSPYPPPSYP
ncbi:hypothetical protein HKD37_12G034448 [Glycine soja]